MSLEIQTQAETGGPRSPTGARGLKHEANIAGTPPTRGCPRVVPEVGGGRILGQRKPEREEDALGALVTGLLTSK